VNDSSTKTLSNQYSNTIATSYQENLSQATAVQDTNSISKGLTESQTLTKHQTSSTTVTQGEHRQSGAKTQHSSQKQQQNSNSVDSSVSVNLNSSTTTQKSISDTKTAQVSTGTNNSSQKLTSNSNANTNTNAKSSANAISGNKGNSNSTSKQNSATINFSTSYSQTTSSAKSAASTYLESLTDTESKSETTSRDSQFVYMKNYETIVRFARNNYNSNEHFKGPDMVFVIEDPFIAEIFKESISWGMLAEPSGGASASLELILPKTAQRRDATVEFSKLLLNLNKAKNDVDVEHIKIQKVSGPNPNFIDPIIESGFNIKTLDLSSLTNLVDDELLPSIHNSEKCKYLSINIIAASQFKEELSNLKEFGSITFK